MKYITLLIIALLLLFTFSKSTCNGITGYGICSTNNGKVTHYSPLNYI